MPEEEKRRRKRFNRIMAGTRVVAEQAIGTLKQRFPILLGKLRMKQCN